MFDSDESEIGRKLSVYSPDHKSTIELLASIVDLENEVNSAKKALGGFVKEPFDGSLVGGINALSMRCASNELHIKELETKQLLDQRQCDVMTDHAATLSVRVAELDRDIAEHVLILEQQDRTLIRYREALTKIANPEPDEIEIAHIIAKNALN